MQSRRPAVCAAQSKPMNVLLAVLPEKPRENERLER